MTLAPDFVDPVMILEVTPYLKDVVFPEPGEYRLQLLTGGDLIIERRIPVMPVQEMNNG